MRKVARDQGQIGSLAHASSSKIARVMLPPGSYRITKYNPRLRDKSGAYLPNEWTSVTDIGKDYTGDKLTVEEYLRVEGAYASAAQLLWRNSQQLPLIISGLEEQALEHRLVLLKRHPELCQGVAIGQLTEGQEIDNAELLARVVQLNLREFIWCRLQSQAGFYLHFGWDFYMYSGGVLLEPAEKEQIKESGLFVEDFKSPYL